METSPEEIRFFDEKPQLIGLYAALRAQLARAYPEMGMRVGKTQISFLSPRVFARPPCPGAEAKAGPRNFFWFPLALAMKNSTPASHRPQNPTPAAGRTMCRCKP